MLWLLGIRWDGLLGLWVQNMTDAELEKIRDQILDLPKIEIVKMLAELMRRNSNLKRQLKIYSDGLFAATLGYDIGAPLAANLLTKADAIAADMDGK